MATQAENAAASSGQTQEILAKPALLFAGQGSQRPGMGKKIAENNPEAMALWQKAEKASGLPLRAIYWEGEESEMSATGALQPALTVFNYTLWNEFRKKTGIRPIAAAGHSLGEFSAFAAAKAITPERAIELTALRGRLMAEADPQGKGAMAAILKLDASQVEALVKEAAAESGELLIAANFNTPSQLVISGARNAVDLACKKAKTLRGRSIPLAVSGAFHSPMMNEANAEFALALEKTEWRDPEFPVYCNVNAMPAANAKAAKLGLLPQMVSPVRWIELIRNLYLSGARWWLDIGPRPVLGKMVRPDLEGFASEADNLRVEQLNSLSDLQNFVSRVEEPNAGQRNTVDRV